jgi:hypothetical protein
MPTEYHGFYDMSREISKMFPSYYVPTQMTRKTPLTLLIPMNYTEMTGVNFR